MNYANSYLTETKKARTGRGFKYAHLFYDGKLKALTLPQVESSVIKSHPALKLIQEDILVLFYDLLSAALIVF